jgi:hypothetical protein
MMKNEVVHYYKYLGLEIDFSYNWNSCVEKNVKGGTKDLYYLFYGVRNKEVPLWNTGADNNLTYLSCLMSKPIKQILEES